MAKATALLKKAINSVDHSFDLDQKGKYRESSFRFPHAQ
jgi:hypothetical protein